MALEAPEQFQAVRRHVADHRVRGVELAEKTYHLVLAGRLVAGLRVGDLPQLLDRSLAVHQPD